MAYSLILLGQVIIGPIRKVGSRCPIRAFSPVNGGRTEAKYFVMITVDEPDQVVLQVRCQERLVNTQSYVPSTSARLTARNKLLKIADPLDDPRP